MSQVKTIFNKKKIQIEKKFGLVNAFTQKSTLPLLQRYDTERIVVFTSTTLYGYLQGYRCYITTFPFGAIEAKTIGTIALHA